MMDRQDISSENAPDSAFTHQFYDGGTVMEKYYFLSQQYRAFIQDGFLQIYYIVQQLSAFNVASWSRYTRRILCTLH
jgi:hypothetical protein